MQGSTVRIVSPTEENSLACWVRIPRYPASPLQLGQRGRRRSHVTMPGCWVMRSPERSKEGNVPQQSVAFPSPSGTS